MNKYEITFPFGQFVTVPEHVEADGIILNEITGQKLLWVKDRSNIVCIIPANGFVVLIKN